MKFRLSIVATVRVASSAALFLFGGAGASGQEDRTTSIAPKGHFKVEMPADLMPEAAETVYRDIRAEMAARYALARMPDLRNYLGWRRYNRAPYRSATHGARYVNNYGNRLAGGYGAFEKSGPLPQGAILVKDSFTATADGGVYPGPMFVMKKMPAGFDPAGGDWRYSMILPDGSLFGETGGVNAERVEFCAGCHASRERYDFLFFVPEEYRLPPSAAQQ